MKYVLLVICVVSWAIAIACYIIDFVTRPDELERILDRIGSKLKIRVLKSDLYCIDFVCVVFGSVSYYLLDRFF